LEINRKRVAKRLVSGLVAGALALGGLALSGGTASAVTPATTGNRIEGTDRYSTAVAIANKYVATVTAGTWTGNIVVASGGNFPDGLAAASIAAVKGAPILLVPSDGSLPSAVRDWLLINRSTIQGKTAPTVTVVGGTSAVADATVTAMVALLNEGLATPKVSSTRLSGADRYATAAAVNGATGVMGGADKAIIVSGENFADAISAAPLAFANGWPIILTPSSGLNASALATVSGFVTASSSDSFIIVGGKSAVSETVESQLVEAGIPYANITRIAGADRYATSAALNVAMLPTIAGVTGSGAINSPAGAFTGANVALVSGENFADAIASAPFLAAKTGAGEGIHIQLTASASLSAGAQGVIGALAQLARPAKVYIVGGTSAVSAATAAAAVATAQSTNMVGVMACAEGASSVTLTFPKGLDATEQGNLKDGDLSVDGASNATNNAATIVDAVVADDTAIFAVPTLVKGQVVTFGGNPEAGSDTKRTLSAASCTVADDAAAPTVSVVMAKQQATGNTAGAVVLEFSEPVAFKSVTAVTQVDVAATADVLDLADLTVTKADGTALTAAYTPANSTATALDGAAATAGQTGYASKFLVVLKDGVGASDQVDLNDAAGVKVALAAEVTKDLAGNKSVAGAGTIATTATADATAPALTISATCAAGAQASVANAGGLGLAAIATGPFDGAKGNGWKLSVVSKRGQVLPSVSVDAAAKAVVVTADVQYTSSADVVKYVANNGLLAGWALTAAAANLTATAIPGTTANGADSCKIVAVSDEYATGTLAVSVTVNGVAIAAPTYTAVTTVTKKQTSTAFNLATTGSSLVVTVSGAKDLAGNAVSGSQTVVAN
jgi:putative cell wall-binding protein